MPKNALAPASVNALAEQAYFGNPNIAAQGARARTLRGGYATPEQSVEAAKGMLGFTPVVGDVISGYDALQALKQGNYGEAALNAVGLLPFVPSMAGVVGKNLPRELPLKDYGPGFSRFTKPLPEGRLYRETSAEGFSDLFKGNVPFGEPRHFFAEAPEMALGQGANKGLMFEVESAGLKGRPHFGKPGLQPAFLQKAGEFEVTAQPSELVKNMKAVWVTPDVVKNMRPAERRIFESQLKNLEANGITVHRVDVLPGRD